MSLIVRPATGADTDIIARFNRAMAAETEGLELDPDRVRAGVAAVLSDAGKGFYLIAEEEGRAVGQLMVTFEWSDWRNGNFWWIQSVYVEPAHRRQGVFRRLYAETLERARSQSGVCGLRLYVEENNRRAQQAYESLGMRLTPYRLYEVDFVLGSDER